MTQPARMPGATGRTVLVLNAGSRTLKASVVEPATERTVASAAGDRTADATPEQDRALVDSVVTRLGPAATAAAVVGHRIVHGGSAFRAAVVVDDDVLARLDDLSPLAPLHNPVALAIVRAARESMPGVPHVACFDTAFHATLPEVAWRYPVPDAWLDDWGIRRYGFHGLSVEWSVGQAAVRLGRSARGLDLVVAHLGGGCSVTAVRAGRSVWTSMGLTPLEGAMMGSRSGSIDPGALVLAIRRGASADEVEQTLDRDSGFVAIAGTGDLRAVEARARDGNTRARLALEMFVDRAAAEVAAAATRLRRVDAVIFTGGIGEHSARVRNGIVRRLGALRRFQAAEILVIEAREDLVIAAAALRLGRRPGRA